MEPPLVEQLFIELVFFDSLVEFDHGRVTVIAATTVAVHHDSHVEPPAFAAVVGWLQLAGDVPLLERAYLDVVLRPLPVEVSETLGLPARLPLLLLHHYRLQLLRLLPHHHLRVTHYIHLLLLLLI